MDKIEKYEFVIFIILKKYVVIKYVNIEGGN